jgi:hypothetical protein
MKTYKAYLKQGAEGCDYTIGCGQTLINIKTSSIEEAKQKLAEIIAEEYSGERELESAELFEVEQTFMMDTTSIYQEADEREETRKKNETTEKERQEFERLKAKFG